MANLISSTRGVRQVVQSGRRRNTVTAARRQKFLDALACTCNITRSAQFAGLSLTSVYRIRATDEVFARQWRESMAMGFDRLEALVLEHGGAGVALAADPETAEGLATQFPPFDFDKAMTVLKYAQAARNGVSNRATGRPRTDATREETNAALIKALEAARRRHRPDALHD